MSVFRKGDTICFVQKNEEDSMDMFLDRGNFVVSQKPTNDQEYNKALLYSSIYAYSKYLKCEYSKNIMKELEVMKEKCLENSA